MKNLGNKPVMAKNIRRYLKEKGINAKDLSKAIDVPYTTVLSWTKAEYYPRIDKIEKMSEFFGCLKSDLIEDKLTEEKEKDNDTMTDIIVRMRTDSSFLSLLDALVKDEEFLAAVKSLHSLEREKLSGVNEMLKAFTK